MADTEVAIFALVELCARGYQAQAPRPVHRQFVIGEIRSVAEVRIPAFTRANVEHGVSGVFNNVAAIAEAQGELGAARGRRRQNYIEKVVSARTALAQSHSLILKEDKGFTVLAADLVDVQQVRELQGD